MTNTEKQRIAKSLYIKSGLNRKEIASRAGCTEKTLRKWINKFNWDEIKQNTTITRPQLLQDAYNQLKAVNRRITDDCDGVPTKELAYAKAVLRKEIETLADAPLHVYIEVFDEYTNWIEKNYPKKLIELTSIAFDFIEEKARTV